MPCGYHGIYVDTKWYQPGQIIQVAHYTRQRQFRLEFLVTEQDSDRLSKMQFTMTAAWDAVMSIAILASDHTVFA